MIKGEVAANPALSRINPNFENWFEKNALADLQYVLKFCYGIDRMYEN
jgi:hypothetical protein